MAEKVVKHLVVDSGAFIKNAAVKDIGEIIYTINDVVNEIRDKTTRDQLQILPYELKFKEPTQEAIKIVTEFARKTGDLRVLSDTDLRLIALVYTLEKEHVGVDHIRTQPSNKVEFVMPGAGESTDGGKPLLPGFYMKKTVPCDENGSDESSVVQAANESSVIETNKATTLMGQLNDDGICEEDDNGEGWIIPKKTVPMKSANKDQNQTHSVPKTLDTTDNPVLDDASTENLLESSASHGEEPGDQKGEEDEDDDSYYTDDDDDEGWITPGNIDAMKQASLAMNQLQVSSVPVACITTDYAMQNVLIQMGLHVVSVDGMLIRRTQTKILRCFGCFKVMSDCERQFCSHCGNKTLSRVTVTYNDDGTVQYFLSRHKKFSCRGLRYSLPLPKGGKHASNPVLCEDQREAQKRPSKHAKKKVDVFDPDYVAYSSPFAPTDIYSRAAMHGYANRKTGGGRRNPNENHKLYGHRK